MVKVVLRATFSQKVGALSTLSLLFSYRPASQSRIPVEHRQVRIRDSEEGTPARGWAYFTYPARLTPLDTPRKVYTNPLAKSCISCEKGWIYRKNRYNDPEAGLCSGKALVPNSPYSESPGSERAAAKPFFHRLRPPDKHHEI